MEEGKTTGQRQMIFALVTFYWHHVHSLQKNLAYTLECRPLEKGEVLC